MTINRHITDAITTILRQPRLLGAAVAVIAAILAAGNAAAFSTDLYADSSRLATGRWVRVSVTTSGMYGIKAQTLRRWGFSDPSRVRVYGYGGRRIDDQLAAATFVDDLPMAPMAVAEDGSLAFYAVGVETWRQSAGAHYVSQLNMFSNKAYYFLSDTGEDIAPFPATGQPGAANPESTFTERFQHEQDIATPGEAGGILLGEDFRFTPSRTFTIPMPGRVDGTSVWLETSFVAKTLGTSSRIAFNASYDGSSKEWEDIIAATSSDEHYHGTHTVNRAILTDVRGNSLSLNLRHRTSGTVYGAWLDYIAANYTRSLSLEGLTSGTLEFYSSNRELALRGISEGTRVWDVTNTRQVREVNFAADNGSAVWTSDFGGMRTYAAWSSASRLPEPVNEGVVANQNLHAGECVNMVIISPKIWLTESERVAAIHRAEGMKVSVVDIDHIYNEFSSGVPDISGIRKYLKMLYDRGAAEGTPLQYALLMGRATYDNRHNTPAMKNAAPTVPSWYGGTVSESLCDTEGYGTDDFIAMLEDNTGSNKGLDPISIAVGRIPVTSASDAKTYIDKLIDYCATRSLSGWENQIMMLADDEDNGEHLLRSEAMVNYMSQIPSQPMLVNKVYIDAFDKTNGNYPAAREAMFRLLDDGVAWWTFVGHANNHSMTHDGQLTYNDINNMYLKRLPVLFASTCDFLRWDSNTQSGGEILFYERYGGTIATISANRPVWIYQNGLYTEAMGRQLGARDDNGRLLTVGEIYRRAKNDIRDGSGKPVSSPNRLRFVLMGDPAMRLPTPDNIVRLDAVDGIAPDLGSDTEPPCVEALRDATFSGSITDPAGNVLTDFNGTLTASIYDAETTVVSKGNGKDGAEVPFDEHGSRLFAGSAPVRNGHFELKVRLPAEIANNYRPATINMFASSADSLGNSIRAVGVNNAFYVYGIDETAAPDTVPPVIESMYLNTDRFTDGGNVNTSPMLIARISDDNGINLSSAGITGRMVAILDGSQRFTDIASYYTPSDDGSASGVINYPFEDLEPGPHELTLRVFDVANNVAETTIRFNVVAGLPVHTFKIYCDANPASVEANFYVIHDRPDQLITVTITVYDLLGHPLWSDTVTGVSDMLSSTPVTWDLSDGAGRRVGRGIYIYRATVGTPGEGQTECGAKRIAVTD